MNDFCVKYKKIVSHEIFMSCKKCDTNQCMTMNISRTTKADGLKCWASNWLQNMEFLTRKYLKREEKLKRILK